MSLVETAIGWLAPVVCIACEREGSTLCAACSRSDITPFGERCWQCNKLSPRCRTCKSCQRTGSPRYVWISTNYDGLAKGLVQKYKFGHQRIAAQVIAGLMVKTFLSFNVNEEISRLNYLVVPVPTATSRVRQRGFDHSALLAEHIAKQLGLRNLKALGRLGQNRQVGTKKAERLAQAEASYFAKKPKLVAGRNVLLVDDVVTTGATLQAATKILRTAGARHVDVLVFAKRL
jgi:ComF family protein